MVSGKGLGQAALQHSEAALQALGVRRIRLVTTNDNLRAHALFLRLGYRLVKLHLDSMESVRAAKPGVGMTGEDGLPLREMWELEKLL